MKTNPQNKSFRLANSPAVVKLALMELVQTDQEIDDDVRASIKHALTSDPSGRTLSRVKVFVDLTEFQHIQRNAGEQKWDYAALQYCIARQAHFPMLQALFKTVTRRHVQIIRNELKAPLPATNITVIPSTELIQIFDAWKHIQASYQHETERWVALGEEFPQWPLSSLYTAIVIEGTQPLDAQNLTSGGLNAYD
ncbi:hypothetical protein [Limnohabitans sp.]|uniref:hypothetical protein n=2 Tax=Limnohabitans sp. TaxID=1907725 RepID=UPI00286EE41D|nr:hypothetical protein [Limnohabitans sp.]